MDVLHHGEFVQRKWSHLNVGDIVHLTANQPIPVCHHDLPVITMAFQRMFPVINLNSQADIVLLATSSPDGDCFVETADLDGYATRSDDYDDWGMILWLLTEKPTSSCVRLDLKPTH